MKRKARLLALALLVPLLGATARKEAEKKAAPEKPVITHSPALDRLEEMVWANRDKLTRWCLKCMGFEGYRKRVEYLRSRLGEPGINSDIWEARTELIEEIRENMLASYIADMEGRTTEATIYRKIHQTTLQGGEIELEFSITDKDMKGDNTRLRYQVRVIRYDPSDMAWKTVSITRRERSSLQKEQDELRNTVRRKIERRDGKKAD